MLDRSQIKLPLELAVSIIAERLILETATVYQRDYSLVGADAESAKVNGLSSAKWYQTDIPRPEIKAFMKRSDQPAIRDTIVLFVLMIAFGVGGVYFWGSWHAVPIWMAYGVLYGSAMDSRWHECSHGTAFKTRWMNEALYQVASFMMIRNPVRWKWSHARHHTDTIIVGRDPEIVAKRPPSFFNLLLGFTGIADTLSGLKLMLINASGKLETEEADFIPESEVSKVIAVARIWAGIYAVVIGLSVALSSWIPLMLIGLPRMYGAWHHVLTGITQHAGLAENEIDHRLNSRTVYMNPISRFIYWNMNYHVEHHMFPMVPYHQLPKLHERIKSDFPKANSSLLDAYMEIIPALWQQRKNADHFVLRPLPAGAEPYRHFA